LTRNEEDTNQIVCDM